MEGLPKITQENKIEKPKIKEGVDFVFEQNPELIKIGTKEQYSEYLDTIFPDSKIKDILYTGSREPFDEFREEKTFGTYFGSWISHYYSASGKEGRGYKHRKAAILNIKNPRIINKEILTSENNNENNEGVFLSALSPYDIKKFYNMKNEDGIIELGHFHGNRDVSYSDSEDMFNLDFQKLLDSIFGKDADFSNSNEDQSVILKKIHNTIKESINNQGREFGNAACEIVVFEKEQIHVLGTKQDLEKFKEFIENKQDSQS